MEGRHILKKFTKVIFIIIGLIGITSIAAVQAVQPYKHITYGDVSSAFEAYLTGASRLTWISIYHAAPVEGRAGQIQPWNDEYVEGDFCVNDAHGIWMAWVFNMEEYKVAKQFYLDETVNGLVKTEYVLNGTLLENEYTALKRTMYHPDPHYWYWYGIGVLYKPGELPAGLYYLDTYIKVYIDGFGWWTVINWHINYTISECWH